jgi:hypothetical protein
VACLANLSGGFFRFLPALWLTLLAAAMIAGAGCQSDPAELPNMGRGAGSALTPYAVSQYAREHGVSNEQARHELQAQVSQHDEEAAVRNIGDAGTKLE